MRALALVGGWAHPAAQTAPALTEAFGALGIAVECTESLDDAAARLDAGFHFGAEPDLPATIDALLGRLGFPLRREFDLSAVQNALPTDKKRHEQEAAAAGHASGVGLRVLRVFSSVRRNSRRQSGRLVIRLIFQKSIRQILKSRLLLPKLACR